MLMSRTALVSNGSPRAAPIERTAEESSARDTAFMGVAGFLFLVGRNTMR